MKRQLPFLIVIGVLVVAIGSIIAFGTPVQKKIDRCNQLGGVWLRQEHVCVRLQKIDTDN